MFKFYLREKLPARQVIVEFDKFTVLPAPHLS
jgi:hypothetical protein